MKVFIVYAHPCRESLTREVLESFCAGLLSAGHSFEISDLYAMDFRCELSEAEYRREAFYRRELPLPDDVRAEQGKVNGADALVFIAPLFWSDVPAKLKGWFDRVWTYGFAYGEDRSMKRLEKGLFLISAGNSLAYFKETGIGAALEKTLLRDRLYDRVESARLVILDETSRELPQREDKREAHLRRAFEEGAGI
jgi:NAD(P)H dehydrogenase (quinone)